jgi:hypothetical protein
MHREVLERAPFSLPQRVFAIAPQAQARQAATFPPEATEPHRRMNRFVHGRIEPLSELRKSSTPGMSRAAKYVQATRAKTIA